MRTHVRLLAPLYCLLAACGGSEGEGAEAERARSAKAPASASLAEAPVDLGDGLLLTVLERGTGAFVTPGGRVRVHYDASIVAVAEPQAEAESSAETDAETAEPAAATTEQPEPTPAEPAAPTGDTAPTGEAPADAGATGATEAAPASDAQEVEPEPDSQAPAADASAPPDETPAEAPAEAPADAAAPAEPASELPRRFDSSRTRGVPDTWDLARTASPRLIEGLRRGLVGLTAGSRLTLRVPAALAWGDEGLPKAGVPPGAEVLYEIELIEVLP